MRINNKGFTLVEVLVAILILSISLLGMAGLQIVSLQSSSGALARSQATMLSYDLVERIRRNDEFVSYYVDLFKNLPDMPISPSCLDSGCSSAELANEDFLQWLAELNHSIPGATATLVPPAPDKVEQHFILSIVWDESLFGNTTGNTLMSHEMEFEL